MVVLATLSVSLVGFAVLTRSVADTLARQNAINLRLIRSMFDQQVNKVQLLAKNLAEDPLVLDFLGGKSRSPSARLFQLGQLALRLSQVRTELPYTELVFVYDASAGLLVSNKGPFTVDQFRSLYLEESGDAASQPRFPSGIATRTFQSLRLRRQIPVDTFAYSEPVAEGSSIGGGSSVGFLFDSLMERTIGPENMTFPESLFFIRGRKGLLYRYGNEDLYQETVAKSPEAVDFGPGLVVEALDSEYADLQYVLVVRNEEYYRDIRWLLFFVLASGLGVLAVGVVFSLFAARRFSRPIQRLLHLLSPKDLGGEIEDEYSYLANRTEEILRSRQLAQEAAEAARPVLRNAALERLLHGYTELNQQTQATLRNILDGFPFRWFFVCLVEAVPGGERREGLEYGILMTAVAKALEGSVSALIFETGTSRIAAIVNVDQEETDSLLPAARVYREIIETRELSLRRCSVGVGRVAADPVGIRQSYEEACSILRDLSFREESGPAAYARGESTAEAGRTLSGEDRRVLKRLALQANPDKLLRTLDALMDSILSLSVEAALAQAHELVSLPLGLVRDRGTEGSEAYAWVEGEPSRDLSRAVTRGQLKETVRRIYLEAQRLLGSWDAVEAERQAFSRFIDQSLTDINLSLESLADHFGYSPGYLSTHFKDLCGQGFKAYLTGARIARAQQLLRDEPELAVADVALRSGFASEASFFRNFRRETGDTPLNFRQKLSKFHIPKS